MVCPYRAGKNSKKDTSYKFTEIVTETINFGKCYEDECPFFIEKDGKKICTRGRAKITSEDI